MRFFNDFILLVLLECAFCEDNNSSFQRNVPFARNSKKTKFNHVSENESDFMEFTENPQTNKNYANEDDIFYDEEQTPDERNLLFEKMLDHLENNSTSSYNSLQNWLSPDEFEIYKNFSAWDGPRFKRSPRRKKDDAEDYDTELKGGKSKSRIFSILSNIRRWFGGKKKKLIKKKAERRKKSKKTTPIPSIMYRQGWVRYNHRKIPPNAFVAFFTNTEGVPTYVGRGYLPGGFFAAGSIQSHIDCVQVVWDGYGHCVPGEILVGEYRWIVDTGTGRHPDAVLGGFIAHTKPMGICRGKARMFLYVGWFNWYDRCQGYMEGEVEMYNYKHDFEQLVSFWDV